MELPSSATRDIALRAVKLARSMAPSEMNIDPAAFVPNWSEGVAGISVPDAERYVYLQQTESQAESLTGRTMAVRGASGNLRLQSMGPRGERKGVVTRGSATGELIEAKYTGVHFSRDPFNFLTKSLQLSVNEWKSTLNYSKVIRLLKDSEAGDDIRAILEGF